MDMNYYDELEVLHSKLDNTFAREDIKPILQKIDELNNLLRTSQALIACTNEQRDIIEQELTAMAAFVGLTNLIAEMDDEHA